MEQCCYCFATDFYTLLSSLAHSVLLLDSMLSEDTEKGRLSMPDQSGQIAAQLLVSATVLSSPSTTCRSPCGRMIGSVCLQEHVLNSIKRYMNSVDSDEREHAISLSSFHIFTGPIVTAHYLEPADGFRLYFSGTSFAFQLKALSSMATRTYAFPGLN